MRVAERVLFLVGAIVSIVSAVGYAIGSILFFVASGGPVKDFIIENIQNGNIVNNTGLTAEELAEIMQSMSVVFGVICVFLVVFAILNSIFAFKARKNNQSKALLVLNIVFGVLSYVLVNIVGAIFALIMNARDEDKARKAVEVKQE